VLSLIFALHCQISSRFLKPTKKTIDLVGNEKMKASTNVRHIVLPCSTAAMPQVIPDVISCYGRLVFPSVFCLLVIFLEYVFHLHVFYSAEAVQLFSQRKGNPQMNLLDYCLEHGLYMGKYSSLNVR